DRVATGRGSRQARAAHRTKRVFNGSAQPSGPDRRVANVFRRVAHLAHRPRQCAGPRPFRHPGETPGARQRVESSMIAAFRDNRVLRRLIFASLNVAAAFVLVMLVVLPTWTLIVDRDGRIAEQRQLLGRLTAVASQAQAVRALLDQSEAVKDPAEFVRN